MPTRDLLLIWNYVNSRWGVGWVLFPFFFVIHYENWQFSKTPTKPPIDRPIDPLTIQLIDPSLKHTKGKQRFFRYSLIGLLASSLFCFYLFIYLFCFFIFMTPTNFAGLFAFPSQEIDRSFLHLFTSNSSMSHFD